MKVKELIEKLQTMPQDLEVVYKTFGNDEQSITSVHHNVDVASECVDIIDNMAVLKPFRIEKAVIGDME